MSDWTKSIAEPTAASPTARKGLTWEDCIHVARLASSLAYELEPDVVAASGDIDVVRTDRSKARMAFVDTVLIAFAKGQFTVTNDDEDDGPVPF